MNDKLLFSISTAQITNMKYLKRLRWPIVTRGLDVAPEHKTLRINIEG